MPPKKEKKGGGKKKKSITLSPEEGLQKYIPYGERLNLGQDRLDGSGVDSFVTLHFYL